MRFSYARDFSNPVSPLPDGSGSLTSGVIGRSDALGLAFASSYSHAFRPGAVNELRLGYTRRALTRRALNDLPTFLIDGYQQLGPPPNAGSNLRTDVTQINDVLSAQRGRHSLRAGLDFRLPRLDIVQPPSPNGIYRFSALFTGAPLASFLLGQVQEFSIDVQTKPLRPRATTQEFFFHNDWKVTRRLTMNAGVRYTLNFPSTECDDQGAVFNLGSQQLEYLGRGGFPRSARVLHKRNLGPRLGLALRLNNRTVLRSAYALIWIDQAGITTPFTTPQFPFLQTISRRTLDNIQPAFVLSAGPDVTPIPLTPDAGLGQGVFAVDGKLGSGYAQQWNFSVQRLLAENLALEVAYAGSKISHVGIPDVNLNQLSASQLALGESLLERVANPFFGEIPPSSSLGGPTLSRAQLLKPYPRFTTISLYRNNVGNTSYQALQLKLEKRLSQALSFLVSYTRSKLIDEASSVFDAAILTGPVATFPVADSFNRRLERDVSTGDIPNALAASFTWDFLRRWTLAGIVTVQSGLPIAVTQAVNFNAFAGYGTQRPDRVGDPTLPASSRSVGRFFNTAAFVQAGPFTLGNSSRNPVRGPGYRNVDLALIRRFAVRDRRTLEFRTEIFNLTNTPALQSPNGVVGDPAFASITAAGDPRVMQFALKLSF